MTRITDVSSSSSSKPHNKSQWSACKYPKTPHSSVWARENFAHCVKLYGLDNDDNHNFPRQLTIIYFKKCGRRFGPISLSLGEIARTIIIFLSVGGGDGGVFHVNVSTACLESMTLSQIYGYCLPGFTHLWNNAFYIHADGGKSCKSNLY